MKNISKITLALLSGLMLAASWPIHGFAPLIFIAFVPLIFLQDNETTRQRVKGNVFLLSFLAFLVWNSLTTWWVWNSTPAGSVAMILLNSAFMATTFWLYHFTRKNVFKNKNGYFLLILFFLAFENLHLNWQLNWPWLNIGNVFSHNHTWVQWYEFTGVAGGTIWVLLANILAYKVIKSLRDNKTTRQQVECQQTTDNGQQSSPKSHKLSNSASQLLIFLSVVIIPIIISKIMYHSYEEKGDEVEVVVVQPNIDPYKEEFRLSAAEILDRNFSVAEPLITEKTRFVVSPESSVHENIWLEKIDRYYSIKELKLFSKMNDLTYVIGASTFGMASDRNDFAARKFYDADEYYFAYNSALSVDADGIQIHQKSKLTPGVEMMPSWWLLRPLKNLAIDLGGIVGTLKSEDKATVFSYKRQQTTDKRHKALPTILRQDSITPSLHHSITTDYKVAPLICYESVFGAYVTEFVRNGANMIFVITNDGWWGDTPGHRQHFEMSKLRAIENRRSIARSANTGISAFINQRGDVVQETKYWEPVALRDVMKVNDEMTFYSRHGDYIYRAASFVAVMVLCFSIVISISRKR